MRLAYNTYILCAALGQPGAWLCAKSPPARPQCNILGVLIAGYNRQGERRLTRSEHERLAELRAEIAILRRQIARLAPNDTQRLVLYCALLARYHESFILYGCLFKN